MTDCQYSPWLVCRAPALAEALEWHFAFRKARVDGVFQSEPQACGLATISSDGSVYSGRLPAQHGASMAVSCAALSNFPA